MIEGGLIDFHPIIKLIIDKNHAFVFGSDQMILINEILKDKYDINNLHVAQEQVFLSLVGFAVNKSLSERIYSKIDLL